MKKLLRILAYVALGLVVLVGAAAAIAPRFIDPNDHRDRIAALVTEQTGRALRLEGPIALSVFPWLGVDVRDASLGNAPGFDDPVFARAERIEVRVKLLPLLRRAVEMDTARVTGLELRLARDESGRTNWEDLTGAAARPADAPGAGGLAAFAFGGVEVAGGTVTWEDRQGAQRLEVRALTLRTGALDLSAPVPVEAAFEVEARAPALSGQVSARGEMVLDPGAGTMRLLGLDVSAGLAGEAIPSGRATLALGGGLVYEPGKRRVETDALDARLELTGDGEGAGTRITLGGAAAYDIARTVLDASSFAAAASDIAVAGITGTAKAGGALRVDLGQGIVDARALAIDTDLGGPAFPGGALALEARADLRADLGAGTVVLTGLSGAAPDLALPGQEGSRAALTVEAQSVTGNYRAGTLSASALAVRGTITGQSVPGGSLPFDARSDVALADAQLTLSGIELAAADLRATGEARLSGLDTGPRLDARVALAGADPRTLAALAGVELPPTRDPQALRTLAGEATFSANAERLEVERMRIALDDSTVEGSLRLPEYGLRGAHFDVAVDRLDADRYLPPEAGGTTATPGALAAATAAQPVDALRALDVEGRVRVARLRSGGLDIAKLDAGLVAKDGLLRFSPARATLYGGTYSGNVTVDARAEKVAVTLDERLEGIDAAALVAALGGDAAALGLDAGKSTVSLAGSATGVAGRGRYLLRGIALDASVAGKRFPGGRLDLGLGGAYDVDLQAQTVTSDGFTARFGDLEAKGKLAVTGLLDDPHLAGTVATSQFDPRRLLGELGIVPPITADPKALSSARLSATVTASSSAVSLKGLDLALDQSRITGDVEVRGFDPPAIRADLDIDAIDADRYLPPSTPRVAAPPGAAVALLPVATLRALDLDGEVRVGQLRLGGVNASNARITARASDGQARIHPLGADLYGGVYQGDVRIDARQAPPALVLEERLSGTEIGALITDARGRTPISGRAEIAANLSARGETTEALKRTLSGSATVTLRDGAFRGMNLTRRICEALAGQKPSAQAEGDGALTRFTSLTGSAEVRDGVIVNRDLVVSSPLLRVTGSGGASLVTEQINFGAQVVLEDACQSEQGLRLGGVDLAQIGRAGVPVRCQGSFDRPGCGPDSQFVVPLVAQQVIQRAIGGSVGDALQGDTGNAVNSILQGILNSR